MRLRTRRADDHPDGEHSDGQERRRPDPRRATSAVALGALVATLAAGWVASTDPAAANRGWDAGHAFETSRMSADG